MKTNKMLADSIRDIPDFPKKGIIFKDITTLLADPKMFKKAVDEMYKSYKQKQIDYVVCVEARGFIFGAARAYQLGCGLVPVRKPGKLPYKTQSVTYALEYGKDTLEMHKDAIHANSKVLVVDDLLATGGTIVAVCKLLKKSKAKVIGLAFLIELGFLKGRQKLKGYKITTVIKY